MTIIPHNENLEIEMMRKARVNQSKAKKEFMQKEMLDAEIKAEMIAEAKK